MYGYISQCYTEIRVSNSDDISTRNFYYIKIQVIVSCPIGLNCELSYRSDFAQAGSKFSHKWVSKYPASEVLTSRKWGPNFPQVGC